MFFGWQLLGEARQAALAAELRAERAEHLEVEAQLATLSARLSPHLLFNALSTVAALIPVDAGRAEQTLLRLAEPRSDWREFHSSRARRSSRRNHIHTLPSPPRRDATETAGLAGSPSSGRRRIDARKQAGKPVAAAAVGACVITGQTGTGKSHLLKAFGLRACQQGISIRYARCVDVLDDLHAGLADGTYPKRMRAWAWPALLIIDDVGLGQLKKRDDEPTAAHTPYNLVDRRHGHASTAISCRTGAAISATPPSSPPFSIVSS